MPPETHRLKEKDIIDFVNCIKNYVFICIFNKDYIDDVAKACQYLCMLRPGLIVPTIMERFDVYYRNILIHTMLICIQSFLINR